MSVSILYCSCYMYRALWAPFRVGLERYWPDRPYPFYLCTDGPLDDIKGQVGDTQVLHSKEPADNTRNYIARVLSYLQSVSTKYVLFWYDDMFLSGPVQTKAVEDAVARMDADPRIKVIKLSSCSSRFTGNIQGAFQEAHPSDSYILNVQPSLLDREFLLEVLREVNLQPNLNGPSDYEVYGTESALKRPYVYLRSLVDLVPVFRDGGVVRAGIVDAEARAFLAREGLSLPTDDRGCIYDSRDPALTATLNPQLKQELRNWYSIVV